MSANTASKSKAKKVEQQPPVEGMKVNAIYLNTLFKSTKKYNILYGGSGSGKSFAIAQFIIQRMIERPNYRILVTRKGLIDVRDSVHMELSRVIKWNGYSDLFEITTNPLRIKFKNGSEVIFRGWDDPEKIKSISGLNMIWMEEISENDEEDFMEAIRRLRGEAPWPHQIIMSFNPTSEMSWLKKTFFDEADKFIDPETGESDLLTIHSTYRDNYYSAKDDWKKYVIMPENQRRVYEFGEWGRVSTDGLYYGRFDSMAHAKEKMTYNERLPLYLSFDFNVLPSVTCIVGQMPDDKTLHIIDEITLPSPNNNTRAVCQAVMSKYGFHTEGVTVTGDASGANQSTTNEAGHNNYTIIQKELGKLRPRMMVPTSNPNHIPRGNFINAIFGEGNQGLSITVDRKCKALLQDLTYQPQKNDGKKEKGAQTKDGKRMERWGHSSDAFDYLVCLLWPVEYDMFNRGPKKMEYMIGRNKISSKFA